MPPELRITTSWDDGAHEDLRLAELLDRYQLPACFYIPRDNPERAVLGARDIASLATRFEIGAHTISHLRLTSLPEARAFREIRDSKTWLEDVIGRPVESFCYPGGQFTPAHAREVEAAGFVGARTADWLCLDPGRDPYRILPSSHVYAHPRWVNVLHCVRREHPAALWTYLRHLGAAVRPAQLVERMLKVAATHGGTVHVWGHSWEIAERGLWSELEEIFALLAGARAHATMMDNATLARRIRGAQS